MRQREILTHAKKYLPEALRIVQAGGYATALPQLTAAEKALLYHYTEDGYDALNAGLHTSLGVSLGSFGQGLVTALAKLPPHVGEAFSGVRLRTSELQFYQSCALSGTPVRWPAFLSATLKDSIAMMFLRTEQKNGLFVMQSKTGRLIETVAKHGVHGQASGQNEYEVLFAPQTEFDVLAVEDEPDYTRITLDEL